MEGLENCPICNHRLYKMYEGLVCKNWKCEISGEDYTRGMCLHVHHILSRSSNPELTFDEENLMVLCENCHKEIHQEINMLFISRVQNSISKGLVELVSQSHIPNTCNELYGIFNLTLLTILIHIK